MAHSTIRWVINVSSSFPTLHLQIEVKAISNLAVVLLSFIILNLTTEVQLKVLALYLLRYGTLKRGNGDATSAVCRLRWDVSEALYAIPSSLYDTKSMYATQLCKRSRPTCCQINYKSKFVRRGDARRGDAIQDVRSHNDLPFNVIHFVGRTISMVIWSDHCLLVALWFRFHI